MAEVNLLYRHPLYYDIIFGRDVAPEVDFLIDLFQQQVGRPLRSVIELGCGPGYYARAFALRGYDTCGLEWYEEMIRFARSEAGKEGAAVGWIAGEMRDFTLPIPFDLAFCLFELDRWLALDRRFRRALPGGGRDRRARRDARHRAESPAGNQPDRLRPFHYEGERNGCKVVIDWETDVRTSTLTQTAEVEIVVRIDHNGSRSEPRHRTVGSFATPPFLAATARLSEPWSRSPATGLSGLTSPTTTRPPLPAALPCSASSQTPRPGLHGPHDPKRPPAQNLRARVEAPQSSIPRLEPL